MMKVMDALRKTQQCVHLSVCVALSLLRENDCKMPGGIVERDRKKRKEQEVMEKAEEVEVIVP